MQHGTWAEGSLAPSRDSVAPRQTGKAFLNPGKTGIGGSSETSGGMGWDRPDTLGHGQPSPEDRALASEYAGAMSCMLVV